jgi:hypothetical protein
MVASVLFEADDQVDRWWLGTTIERSRVISDYGKTSDRFSLTYDAFVFGTLKGTRERQIRTLFGRDAFHYT